MLPTAFGLGSKYATVDPPVRLPPVSGGAVTGAPAAPPLVPQPPVGPPIVPPQIPPTGEPVPLFDPYPVTEAGQSAPSPAPRYLGGSVPVPQGVGGAGDTLPYQPGGSGPVTSDGSTEMIGQLETGAGTPGPGVISQPPKRTFLQKLILLFFPTARI